MTLDKAISWLVIMKWTDVHIGELDKLKALDLGIDALKSVRATRGRNDKIPIAILPGETK